MSRLALFVVLVSTIFVSCTDRRYVQPMHTQSHHGHAVNIQYDVTLADTVVLLDEMTDIISIDCAAEQIVIKSKKNPVWPVGTVLVSAQRKCGAMEYIQHLITKEPTASVTGDHVELVIPVVAASPTECFKHAKITANLEQGNSESKYDTMQMKDKEFAVVQKAFPSDKPLLEKGPYSMTCVDNGDDKGCSLSFRPKATFLLDIGFLKLNYFELSVNSDIAAQLRVRHFAQAGYTGNFEHRIGDVNCAFGACWKWTLKIGPISATMTINLPTYAAVKINAGGKIDFVTKAKISMTTKFGLVYDGTWRTVFQNTPQMEFKVENVNSDANFEVTPSLQLGMSADISDTARALISYNSYLAAKGSFVGGCDINVNGGMKVSHDSGLEFKSILKFLNRRWAKDLFEKILDFTKAVCPGLQNAIGNLEWKKGQKEAGAFANFKASAWFAPVMVLGAVASVMAVAVVVIVAIKSRKTTTLNGESYFAVQEELPARL